MYTIQETTDYNQFKYIKSNRSVKKRHVQRLINSFKTNPKLVITRPVLVNEKMQIIDGQHRVQACEFLKLPVYFIIAPDLNIGTAQLLNVLQEPWSVMDYARSYAMEGNENYQKFLDLVEEHHLPAMVAMVFLHGRRAHKLSRDFRSGNFKLNEDMGQTNQRLDWLEEFAELFPHAHDYTFAMAAWNTFQIEGYSQKRMLSNMKEQPLQRQATRVDYLRAMEAIYNRNVTIPKQTRFF
jgi:hypothetical protein